MEKHEKIGIYDGIKGWCGALGFIGVGVLVYIGPEEIAEELPRHREIGIAMGAFGGLFALALLFHGTEFGFRIQSLVLCIGGAFLVGLVGYAIGPTVHAAWRLSSDGVQVEATVKKVNLRMGKSRTVRSYDVSYLDRKATLKIRDGAREGRGVDVLYLSSDRDVVLAGEKGDSFLTLLDKSIGKWWAIGGSAFALIVALFALVKLKHFLAGRGAES